MTLGPGCYSYQTPPSTPRAPAPSVTPTASKKKGLRSASLRPPSFGELIRAPRNWNNIHSGYIPTIDGRLLMAENVYKVIELVGTSNESWEKATAAAINRASKTLRDLRVAEVVKLDVQLKNGKVEAYRSRISVSFKYESTK